MKSFRSKKIELRETLGAGLGAFAKEPFHTGEVAWIRSGHIVAPIEAARLDKQIGDFSVQIHDDFFLCPRSADEVSDLVIRFNHSCAPNVGVYGQVVFVAMRDISVDEQLCVDYATIAGSGYRLECSCGAATCRKVVTGEDWKLPELQERYRGYFSHFLQQKINRLSGPSEG